MTKPLATLVLLALLATTLPAQKDAKKDAKLELSKEEQQFVDLTNQARVKEKLKPLTAQPLLFKMARAHSENMAKQDKLVHVLDGKIPEQRMEALGYKPVMLKENVGKATMLDPSVNFENWLGMPLTKECIVNKPATDIGIGIAKDDKGFYFYTMVTSARAK